MPSVLTLSVSSSSLVEDKDKAIEGRCELTHNIFSDEGNASQMLAASAVRREGVRRSLLFFNGSTEGEYGVTKAYVGCASVAKRVRARSAAAAAGFFVFGILIFWTQLCEKSEWLRQPQSHIYFKTNAEGGLRVYAMYAIAGNRFGCCCCFAVRGRGWPVPHTHPPSWCQTEELAGVQS